MPPETTPPKTGIALETPFAKVAFVNFAPKQLIFFSILGRETFLSKLFVVDVLALE